MIRSIRHLGHVFFLDTQPCRHDDQQEDCTDVWMSAQRYDVDCRQENVLDDQGRRCGKLLALEYIH